MGCTGIGAAAIGGTGPAVGGVIEEMGGKEPVAGGGSTGSSSTTAAAPCVGPMDAVRRLTD